MQWERRGGVSLLPWDYISLGLGWTQKNESTSQDSMGFLPPSQSIVLQARLTGFYGQAPPLTPVWLLLHMHLPRPSAFSPSPPPPPTTHNLERETGGVLIPLEHSAVVPWSVKSYPFLVKQTG